MYRLIQIRKTPTQLDNLSHIVWQGSRKKDAEGQRKQQLRGHFDMLVNHDFFGAHEFYVDTETFTVTLYDINNNWFSSTQYILEEYDEE